MGRPLPPRSKRWSAIVGGAKSRTGMMGGKKRRPGRRREKKRANAGPQRAGLSGGGGKAPSETVARV